jgi:uncharacterized RDD family membrane protein YckC
MEEKNLSYCESCSFKSFDSKIGLVCGQTDKKPNFKTECEKFEFNKKNHTYFYNSLIKNSIKAENKKRVLNYLIDAISIMIFLSYIIPILIGSSPKILIFTMIIVLFLYYFFMELNLQKTVGKMITNTIVLDSRTMEKPSKKQIMIRSFFRLPLINFLDAISFLMGLNLHDSASNTKVYNGDPLKIEKAKVLLKINKTFANKELW